MSDKVVVELSEIIRKSGNHSRLEGRWLAKKVWVYIQLRLDLCIYLYMESITKIIYCYKNFTYFILTVING